MNRPFTPLNIDDVVKLNDMYARNVEQIADINARHIEQFNDILKQNTEQIAGLIKGTHIRWLVYPGAVAAVLEIIHMLWLFVGYISRR